MVLFVPVLFWFGFRWLMKTTRVSVFSINEDWIGWMKMGAKWKDGGEKIIQHPRDSCLALAVNLCSSELIHFLFWSQCIVHITHNHIQNWTRWTPVSLERTSCKHNFHNFLKLLLSRMWVSVKSIHWLLLEDLLQSLNLAIKISICRKGDFSLPYLLFTSLVVMIVVGVSAVTNL